LYKRIFLFRWVMLFPNNIWLFRLLLKKISLFFNHSWFYIVAHLKLFHGWQKKLIYIKTSLAFSETLLSFLTPNLSLPYYFLT
jgi:hypothetical protein